MPTVTAITDYTRLPDRNGEPIACHHEWHYAADGLPRCHDGSEGRRCEGETVQCGKGNAPCERHADRRPEKPAAPKPSHTYTVTFTQDELFELQVALEARHALMLDRKHTIEDAGPTALGGEAEQREQLDRVRERDAHVQTAHAKVTRAPRNSDALGALLLAGEADRAPFLPTV